MSKVISIHEYILKPGVSERRFDSGNPQFDTLQNIEVSCMHYSIEEITNATFFGDNLIMYQ